MLSIQHLFVFKVVWLFFVKSVIRGNDNFFHNTMNVPSKYYSIHKVNKSLLNHPLENMYIRPTFLNQLPAEIRNIMSSKSKTFCKSLVTWVLPKDDLNFLSYSVR